MQIKIDAKTVLPGPFKGLENISEEQRIRMEKNIRKYPRAWAHFQQVFARKGSPGHVSMAQKGMGSLIQFSPAPAICAKSCSVYSSIRRQPISFMKPTYYERLVMSLYLIQTTICGISRHKYTETPFVDRAWIHLEK